MNIGLLGFGVVGRGVYDMLAGRDDIRAAWVLCRRDLGKHIVNAPADNAKAQKSDVHDVPSL